MRSAWGNTVRVQDYSTEASEHERRGGTARLIGGAASAAIPAAATAAAPIIAAGAASGTIAIGSGAVALIAPPWSLIPAAAGGLLALSVGIAAGVGKKQQRILRGDSAAIAGFVKHVARWSSEKRKRTATTLLKQIANHVKHGKKKIFLSKKLVNSTKAWKVRKNLLAMKLAAIYAVESRAKGNSRKPIVAGDKATIPEVAEQSGDEVTAADVAADVAPDFQVGGVDAKWLIAGGAGLAALLILTRKSE
jgi:hypothetical protein